MSDRSNLEEELYRLMKEYEKPFSEPAQKSYYDIDHTTKNLGLIVSSVFEDVKDGWDYAFSKINFGKIVKYGVGIGAMVALSYFLKDQIISHSEDIAALSYYFKDQIMNYFRGQVIRHKEGIMFGGISGFVGGCINGAQWFHEVDIYGKEKLKFLVESVTSGIVSGSLMQYLCGAYPPEFEVTAAIIAFAGVSTYFLIPYIFVGVERLCGSDKWKLKYPKDNSN